MKVVVLCAGLGTRLRPITKNLPKPLVPIFNRPLFEIMSKRLVDEGFTDVFINTHYLQDVMAREAHRISRDIGFQLKIFPETEEILGSGGAFIPMRQSLGRDPFLVLNGDILTTTSFASLRESFKGLALLSVRDGYNGKDRAIWCSSTAKAPSENGERLLKVHGVSKERPSGCTDARPYSFASSYVASPELLKFLPGQGASDIFEALNLALSRGHEAYALPTASHWADIGSPEQLGQTYDDLAAKEELGRDYFPAQVIARVGPARLYRDSKNSWGLPAYDRIAFKGWVSIGRDVCWGDFRGEIKDSIVLDGADLSKLHGLLFRKIVCGDQVLSF